MFPLYLLSYALIDHCRFVQVAVLEEQKKPVLEKDEDEAREIETNMLNVQLNSETSEVKVDRTLTKETQVTKSFLMLFLCFLFQMIPLYKRYIVLARIFF